MAGLGRSTFRLRNSKAIASNRKDLSRREFEQSFLIAMIFRNRTPLNVPFIAKALFEEFAGRSIGIPRRF
jgi:hypothetical protein